eukprot:1993174-Pyramimonas_sp.AAC.1
MSVPVPPCFLNYVVVLPWPCMFSDRSGGAFPERSGTGIVGVVGGPSELDAPQAPAGGPESSALVVSWKTPARDSTMLVRLSLYCVARSNNS